MDTSNSFSNVGPHISVERIISHFHRFSIEAPKELIKLLTITNGGRPVRILMSIPNHWDGTDNFVALWGIDHPDRNLSYGENLAYYRHYIDQGLLPFGAADSGSLICISTRKSDLDQIRYIDIAEAEPSEPYQKTWWLADDLAEFINSLK
mgnify:CR=1 FL=1